MKNSSHLNATLINTTLKRSVINKSPRNLNDHFQYTGETFTSAIYNAY